MRRIALMIAISLASGCGMVPTKAPIAAKTSKSSTAKPKADAKAATPLEPLAGLKFEALSSQNTRYAGGVGVPVPAAPMVVATAAMPMPMPMASAPPPGGPGMGVYLPPAQPDGLFSGNMNGGFYGFGPSYGSGAPTTLVSISQAETAGSKGPYLAMMAGVVTPVIKAWASDAQLVGSSGSTGADGLLTGASPSPVPSCGGYYGPVQENSWTLGFYSAGRSEMLTFMVTEAKTTIMRAHWAPLDLAATPIAVDNDAALKALVKAIQTRGFQGEEEKSGKDYFLGSPYATNAGCFGPPLTGPGSTEVLYEVPPDARWNANLQVILGKPVWQLNFYANKPVDTYQQGYYLNMSAGGMVDATTGAVIRFGRPSKQTFVVPSPYPGGYPMPVKVPPPGMIPTPAPTQTPEPSVAPSQEAQ
jgi:hypothetical protein